MPTEGVAVTSTDEHFLVGREDPVTGSLNAGLARWLTDTGGVVAPYVAAQCTAVGRTGRVHVDEADGVLWVGGQVTTAVAGTVEL